jgi:hypothetical protein
MIAVRHFVLGALAVATASGVGSVLAQGVAPVHGSQTNERVAARSWPDTTRGVHVFVDQLPGSMTDAQVRFAATHYDGTQKMTHSQADRLRAVNPGFLILHYRLGLALGYRGPDSNCQPTGEYLHIIEGDEWVREWPGDTAVAESWFFHWPQSGTTRVYNCDWGWYAAELDNNGWRTYWHAEVLRQLRANDDDGVFMDSVSVLNHMGADRYLPVLPEIDEPFESAWSARIDRWLRWLQSQQLGGYLIVPNVGAWINSRDATDYSSADGVMVEGFALEADQSPLALFDWQLQIDRSLAAIRRGQGFIAQTYVSGAQERMFALGSYLLIKGSRSYLTIETADEAEWWPEYAVPLGAPLTPPPANSAALDPDGDGVYRRDFDNGVVLVNPSNPWDGSAVTRTIELGRSYGQVQTSGGGILSEDGSTDALVTTTPVTRVTLGPASAAVLLSAQTAARPRRHLRGTQ